MEPRQDLWMKSSLARLVVALTVVAGSMTALGCGTPPDSDEVTARFERLTSCADGPVVKLLEGRARGVVVAGGSAFRGLPYAAPPTGDRRWRAPRPPANWSDIRDASAFAPSCPQGNGSFTSGKQDEDCLYLNVYTPESSQHSKRPVPVLVWLHGGGFSTGAGRDYDPVKLMANGVVVVTINYRLGALGFLSHPALAARRSEPTGNYGLMDQQEALRWVQDNIERFGGDAQNVTVAGESAGGLAVLAQLVSRGSRGLFQRAIVESGSFALTQRTLAEAEAVGEAFASSSGCSDQTLTCLRKLPVATLLSQFTAPVIPGTVDGDVLTESIGTALASGRFAHVPILNGTNHDEELLFILGLGVTVSGGTFRLLPPEGVTATNYPNVIASVLGVSESRAATIVSEYPLASYLAAPFALSALVGDANFACPALQQDRWTSRFVPTFAYELNDDATPARYLPIPAATHLSELEYLFDLPDAPYQALPTPDQERLAASMRAAWARFAAGEKPWAGEMPSRPFSGGPVQSLVPPVPQIETDFAARHHCAFWATR